MSTEQWSAVTVNLGGASPGAIVDPQRAADWLENHRTRFDVVFAQEIPGDDWFEAWPGYRVFQTTVPQYRARSAVLLRKETIEATAYPLGTAGYHGSYVGSALAKHPTLGELVLMSVHASPTRVSEEWAATWKRVGGVMPPQYRGALWDSDLVVESIGRVADKGKVIAAGDYNEARNWDVNHAGNAGAGFFGCVAERGLVDACCTGGFDAVATRGEEGHGGLRLDHVFTSRSLVGRVVVTGLGSSAPADHRPVEFTIG